MLPWFAAFAVCSVAMTIAMVRFMMALVAPRPSSGDRVWWGLGYGLAWVAILYYINRIPVEELNNPADRAWISVLSVSGWITFNAIWLTFWFAIGRAREPIGEPAPMPSDAALLAARAKRIAAAGALTLAVAAWKVGIPEAAITAWFAPEARATSIALLVAGGGFAMFMTGAVRLALYGGGSRSFTVEELGDVFRRKLWRHDSSWLSVGLMFAGAVVGIAGGLVAGFVMGGTATRTVVVLFVVYGLFQAWRGARQRAA